MDIEIQYYHFHLYYEMDNIDDASKVLENLKTQFNLKIGTLWDKPVGPHPIGSCQVTVGVDKFSEVSQWFLLNRNGIDLFVHAVTGNDLDDHTKYVMWMGKSYDLNVEIFR